MGRPLDRPELIPPPMLAPLPPPPSPPPLRSCRYHSTKIFVKAVQLLGIRKQPKWAWVRPIRKHGVTMGRRVFVQYATSDRAVLKLLCDAVTRAVTGLTVQQASNHVTLYASVVSGVLAEVRQLRHHFAPCWVWMAVILIPPPPCSPCSIYASVQSPYASIPSSTSLLQLSPIHAHLCAI